MTDVGVKRIAVPVVGERFSEHFGQSTGFAVFEVDAGKVVGQRMAAVPGEHVCGMAGWLREQGVGTVIVGGLGRGALANLEAAGMEVCAALSGATPAGQVEAWLAGRLPQTLAGCPGHGHEHGHGEGHGESHGHMGVHEGGCHGHKALS